MMKSNRLRLLAMGIATGILSATSATSATSAAWAAVEPAVQFAKGP